jgi:hypothetical protein
MPSSVYVLKFLEPGDLVLDASDVMPIILRDTHP